MRRACRKDLNHDEIANAFRELGWLVLDTWEFAQYLPGFPDLIICLRCKPEVVGLIEIKSLNGGLTRAEAEFHETMWPGRIAIVDSVERALIVHEVWKGEM